MYRTGKEDLIMKKLIIILCLLFVATACGGEDKKAKENTTTEVAEQSTKTENANQEDKSKEEEAEDKEEKEDKEGKEVKEPVKMVTVELDNVTVQCPEDYEEVEGSYGVVVTEELSENNYVGIGFAGNKIDEITDVESAKEYLKAEVEAEHKDEELFFKETEIEGFKVVWTKYKDKFGENEFLVHDHIVILGDKATEKCNVYFVGVTTGMNPLTYYNVELHKEMIGTAIPK